MNYRRVTFGGVVVLLLVAVSWAVLAWRSGSWGLPADARVGEPIDQAWSQSKKFVDVHGTPVAYIDVGSGPPLLLLHGCPFHSVVWRDVVRALASGRRVLAPDLLGLGDTRVKLDDDYRLPREAAMVLGFLDALGLERIDIVGADHGGATLQVLMGLAPERISRAVLTNAEAYDAWPSEPERAYLEAIVNPLLSPLFHAALAVPSVRRKVFEIAVHDPASLDDEMLASFVEVHTATPVRWQRLVQFYRWQLDPAHRDVTLAAVDGMRRFTQPVLVLWGQEDGNFGQEVAKRLAEDLPNSRLRWIPGAGHLPMLEAPALYVAELEAFFAEMVAP